MNMCPPYAEMLPKKRPVFARLLNFMNVKQARVLKESIIESRFGYCFLI